MSKQTDLINVTDAITVSGSNVGIGVTPSAWSTSGTWFRALDLQNGGGLASFQGSPSTQVITNAYFDGGSWRYKSTNPAGRYVSNGNIHHWDIAASGTAGNALSFSEAMRISSNGDLFIGATSESSLQAGTVDGIGLRGDSGARYFSRNSTGTRYQIQFMNPNGSVGRIETTGTSTSYITSSDYRLKENVADITDGITRVKQLAPKRFNFIADADTTVDGFIAHEVQDVIPEAISGTKDAMRDEQYEVTPAVLDDDGNVVTEAVMGTRSVPDYQGIDQSKLVPLLTAALQEALTEISDLKARVTALEAV